MCVCVCACLRGGHRLAAACLCYPSYPSGFPVEFGFGCPKMQMTVSLHPALPALRAFRKPDPLSRHAPGRGGGGASLRQGAKFLPFNPSSQVLHFKEAGHSSVIQHVSFPHEKGGTGEKGMGAGSRVGWGGGGGQEGCTSPLICFCGDCEEP